MNEPRPAPERHDAVIDELISAALDGLLDDAAADLGIPQAEAEALVADHPDRAAALRGAKDLLAASPPLDDLARRCLVAAALSAAHPRSTAITGRRRRTIASVAGIAAALVIFAGIGALLAGRSNHDGDDTLAATRAGGQAAIPGVSADFGEVSDPAVLHDLLQAEATPLAPEAESLSGKAQRGTDQEGETPPSETRGPEPSVGDSGPGGANDASPAAGGSDDCAALLAADFEAVGPPVLMATATFEGEPAGVLVLSDGDSRMAVVYSAPDCTILMTQTLTTP